MDFMGTLKSKLGPLPVWVWALFGTGALALFLIRQKSSQKSADKAAANATSTDLGTASTLADLFTVAGVMPYSGGDVYVTQTVNTGPSQPVVNKPGGGPLPVPPGRGVKPPTPSKPTPVKAKPPASAPPKPIQVAVNTKDGVKWNDTLSGIASHYGLSWQQLFAYNTGTGANSAHRSKSTIAKLKKRGPDLVYNGTTFYVPKKGTVYSGGY